MMERMEGVVIEIDGITTKVMSKKHTDCSLCGSCDGDNAVIFCAYNPIGAKLGQTVMVKTERCSVVRATFVMFAMPILAIVAGILVGESISAFFPIPSNGIDIFLGVIFFVASIIIVSLYDRRVKRKNLQPIIEKIIS